MEEAVVVVVWVVVVATAGEKASVAEVSMKVEEVGDMPGCWSVGVSDERGRRKGRLVERMRMSR